MNEYLITCINKVNRQSSHEHITHIGNNEAGWRRTREVAITKIESKQEAYYTIDKVTGRRAYVGVVREQGKQPYLRTHADGKWNDNLLAQPECGSSCRLV